MEDTVYPVHFMDNSRRFRPWILNWRLSFDNVLDGDALHGALAELLSIGHWRRLGGRLRMAQGDRLELHAPDPFTDKRPAVAYTKEHFNMRACEHPLAATMPAATAGPSLQRPAADFTPLTMHANTPTTMDDLVDKDVPPLALHIVTFADATLVSLTWPHVLMDGVAQHSLLRAWSLVLGGRASEVPAVLGAHEDILYSISAPPDKTEEEEAASEGWRLGESLLTGCRRKLFLARLLWDMYVEKAVEVRTIFLPRGFVDTLHQRAVAEATLAAAGEGDEATTKAPPIIIGTGDVLLAWLVKIVAAARAPRRARPVNMTVAVDLRGRLPALEEAARGGGVYLQNLVGTVGIQLSGAEASGSSLGQTARLCRAAVAAQTTAAQVVHFLREVRRRVDADEQPNVYFGSVAGELLLTTNWTRLGTLDAVDFSAAVVGGGAAVADAAGSVPAGAIASHDVQVVNMNPRVRNVFAIRGKDREGNYWVTGSFTPRVWRAVERAMEVDRAESVDQDEL
ncbi:hypothetical protein PWT90_10138 [Aphanocladium album]|nr:hypothetical protein PWT90_10138 [Aphanocladium album]